MLLTMLEYPNIPWAKTTKVAAPPTTSTDFMASISVNDCVDWIKCENKIKFIITREIITTPQNHLVRYQGMLELL